MIYIGIDPGLTGAVAVLNDGGVQVYDTPVLTVRKGDGIRNEYDENAMATLLRNIELALAPCVAAIELVHAFPRIPGKNKSRGQGVTSAFSFGAGFGIWRGILAALEIPRDYIPPQRWKKVMLDGMGKEKDASRLRAKALFPLIDLSLVKHHGRADAILLAEYRRRLG